VFDEEKTRPALPRAFFAMRQFDRLGSRASSLSFAHNCIFVAHTSLAAAKRDGTREGEGYSSRSESLALCWLQLF
jgi:hypothetical protein